MKYYVETDAFNFVTSASDLYVVMRIVRGIELAKGGPVEVSRVSRKATRGQTYMEIA